jgi:galactokinase
LREKDIPRVTRDVILAAFYDRFGEDPEFLVRVPGGVNLIGDHTDYNDGFVLPMTINRAVWMGVRGRKDGTVRVHSAGHGKELAFDVREALEKGQDPWFEHIRGSAAALRQESEDRGKDLPLTGFDAVLSSDIPHGIGLASSAALEVAALLAFDELGQLGLSKTEIAALAQRAENQWVGLRRNAADSTICALGQAGKALLLDCKSLKLRYFNFFKSAAAVVLDTDAPHSQEAVYCKRRKDYEAACDLYGHSGLRGATLEMLDAHQKKMPEVLYHLVYHILTENMRTRAAATALEYDESHLFGTLMNESHFSLQYEFGASSPELDALCAIARTHSACLGARAMGGGFGGGAVALVYAAAARKFTARVSEKYREETGKDVHTYICTPSDGGRVERL